MKKYLAEAIGTMFLVLMACGSAVLAGPKIGVLGIGLCFGLVLVCLCYCIGNISGCHVNPAVSFGMWVAGKINTKEFIGYVVSQLIGAAIGAGFLYWFVNMDGGYDFGGITEGVADLAANVMQPGATPGMALFAEILFTFFFVLVIFGVTDEKYGFGNFAGLAIGLALGLVNIVGIPVDNCSVNPARSFGPALWSPGAWPDFWIMVVGPLVGALIAAICWKAVLSARAQKESMQELG
ncbi:MAG: aquaporin [Muribaculaceae bacterium]|nr:aquaporin [Muribaculaceae bacterium]